MKIAAFNVENLFDRAEAFNQDNPDDGTEVITAVADLNKLFEKPVYSVQDKLDMIDLAAKLQFNRFNSGPLAHVRKIRGAIFKRPQSGGVEVVATGRDSWIGWAELKMGPVNEVAARNTGRVIRDVKADVLAVVEAENRVVLEQFTDFMHDKLKGEVSEVIPPYEQIMLIDGNDDRGIDVGLMTKAGFKIGDMRSHIFDLKPDGFEVFSRDCPEYAVTTPSGEVVWVLPNHFKSKFGGNEPTSIAKRTAQAVRVAEIYNSLIAAGQQNVVVLGDLNDTPDSGPLAPMLVDTDLKDVSEHSTFDTGQFAGKGTFGLGNDNQKIDYLLLSPNLFNKVTASGMFRKGAWPGVQPKRWDVYPQLKEKVHVASDHHVIWAEINI